MARLEDVHQEPLNVDPASTASISYQAARPICDPNCSRRRLLAAIIDAPPRIEPRRQPRPTDRKRTISVQVVNVHQQDVRWPHDESQMFTGHDQNSAVVAT